MARNKTRSSGEERKGALAAALGEAIRRRREGEGWARTEFAKRCKVGLTSLNEIESGKVTPSLVTLEKLAIGFGCRMGDLLDFDADGAPPPGAGTKALFRLTARLREKEPGYLKAAESLLDALDRGIEAAQ